MSFVFFTSYACVNKTRYLEKFVNELSQQVLDKTHFPPEQIGFFDGSNIETGQDWVHVLGDALRTCKVIVCLCTPHALNSQFCGKEMMESSSCTIRGGPGVLTDILGADSLSTPSSPSEYACAIPSALRSRPHEYTARGASLLETVWG
jgi:TIR domain